MRCSFKHNKCYPKYVRLSENHNHLQYSVMKFDSSNKFQKFVIIMFSWASKFATAETECSFKWASEHL